MKPGCRFVERGSLRGSSNLYAIIYVKWWKRQLAWIIAERNERRDAITIFSGCIKRLPWRRKPRGCSSDIEFLQLRERIASVSLVTRSVPIVVARLRTSRRNALYFVLYVDTHSNEKIAIGITLNLANRTSNALDLYCTRTLMYSNVSSSTMMK